MKDKIDAYFSTVTIEQLVKDLEAAGLVVCPCERNTLRCRFVKRVPVKLRRYFGWLCACTKEPSEEVEA